KSFCLYGASLNLFDTLQAVATLRGWTCSLRMETAPRSPNHRQVYRLHFNPRTEHRIGRTADSIRPESSPWRKEIAWCVKTETKNIITRRRGSVTVMGNTEGFDSPNVSCVVVARPTRQPGLYQQ